MDVGHDRHPAARRRVEVPLVGRVDRRPRRRRGTRQPHQLLVTAISVSERPDVGRAVRVLRRGGLVAFPTETVYGLGADADLRRRAAPALRGQGPARRPPGDRPSRRTPTQLDEWATSVPTRARDARRRAAGPARSRSWCPRRRASSRVATGGLDTVGLRVPDHPLALELLAAFGGGDRRAVGQPVRPGESDDRRCRAHAISARDVDLVLDGGPCAVGVESTIVDCTERPACGAARRRGDARGRSPRCSARAPAVGGTTRAPGTLAAHYAPNARGGGRDARHTRSTAARELAEDAATGRCRGARRGSARVGRCPTRWSRSPGPSTRSRTPTSLYARVARGRRSRPRRRARGGAAARSGSGCGRGRLGRAARAH